MSKELDTINELVGDALAGVRLTLTALRSIQAVVIEGNTVPAPTDAAPKNTIVTTWTWGKRQGDDPTKDVKAVPGDFDMRDVAKRVAKEFAPRTRKPRSDKGKKRNPHTPVVRGTMVLSRKARAALAKRIRKPRGK